MISARSDLTNVQDMSTVLNMTKTTTPIGQALRGLRKAAGLTLADIARIADTAPAYLSKVESGSLSPSTEYAARVTAAIAADLHRRSVEGVAA